MHIPTSVTLQQNEDEESKSHTKRSDFSKDKIWIIVASVAILIVIFAGIVYRWRTKSRHGAQEALPH